MAFDPPTLPPSQPNWNTFQIWWQQVLEALRSEFGGLEAAIAAQDAADAAQLAADDAAASAATATTAATTAGTAAAAAQTTADDITEADALNKSWVTGATITATDAGTDVTITISAHTRHYPQPDGTTVDVAVSGGSLTGRAYSTRYFVSYTDAARAGGAVTYVSSTTEPAQIGDVHVVGESPPIAAADPPASGGTVRPPGAGAISYV